MKKNLLLILCAAMLLSACGQKKATEQTASDATETSAQNDYDYLNPTQDTKTAKGEDLSGKVIALTSSEFLERVTEIDPARGLRYKGHTPCMVDFYADWCGPCMQIKPITEKMAAKYKGKFIIYKINVDKAQDICQDLGIQSIPALLFLKPNEQPRMMVGALSESELDQTIQEFLK
jgi:thioredoxin